MILVQMFVISLCATIGFCTTRLVTNCSPENENSPEDGNRIELTKFELQGCSSRRRTCTFTKGDMITGEIHTKFNYTAKVLFITLKVDVRVLRTTRRTITLVDKMDVCDYAKRGSYCKRIKPGYTMKFEFEEKMSEWTPSFDGIVTVIGMDEDGTIQYCGQVHAITKDEGATSAVSTVLGSLFS